MPIPIIKVRIQSMISEAYEDTGRSGKPERLFFLSRRGRTYSPPAKRAVVSLLRRARALFTKHPPDASPEGQVMPRLLQLRRHALCSWQSA